MNENDHAQPRFPIPPVEPSPDEELAAFEAMPIEVVEPAPRHRRWIVPLVLFLATCASTYVGFWLFFGNGNSRVPAPLVYSLCVMTILACHEAGHFVQAWRYGVRTSLPIFLPMPFTPLGTLGAVIAMDSRIADRKALFDIGITGPIAGLVPTLVFSWLGLHYFSEVRPANAASWQFGEPLVFQWLARVALRQPSAGEDVFIGPMAIAGWVGLLITALNLLPIGQLDGGHVLYALLRRRAHVIASALLAGAIVGVVWKGFYFWWLMLLLLILMGPKHPPTSNDRVPLGKTRIVLGWAMLAFLPLGFTPNPFPGMEGPGSQPPAQQEEGEPPHRRPFLPPSDDDRWVRHESDGGTIAKSRRDV